MVTLVIRQMHLEQFQSAVDILHQTEALHHQCMAPMPPQFIAAVRSAIS